MQNTSNQFKFIYIYIYFLKSSLRFDQFFLKCTMKIRIYKKTLLPSLGPPGDLWDHSWLKLSHKSANPTALKFQGNWQSIYIYIYVMDLTN